MKDLREKETFAFYLLLYAHVLAQLLSHRAFKAELNEFLKIVEQIMKHVKESVLIEWTLVEVLLILAPLSPVDCFKIVHAWHSARPKGSLSSSPVPRSIQNKITFLHNSYKDVLPANIRQINF